jgi:membrane protein
MTGTKIAQFVQTDIWRMRARDLPRSKAIWVKLLRIIILAVRGFEKDHCMFRASALTFYSLLSIVPVLAMAFGLAKGFGFEKTLERQLFERFQGQEEILLKATSFAHSLLENTKGGLIAGIGILLLFWTIIRVLGNIEDSFNHIWGIQKPRGFARKISDYLSAMLVCPVLFIVSSAVTVVIGSQVKTVVERIELLGAVSGLIFFSLKFLPYAVMWILFTFIYMFMPNKRIKVGSGLFAGIVAGTLFQLFQLVYVTFQVGVAKYNAIYGSFAALPLFLVWLQVSWMIVLLGAELSCAHQNVENHEFEPDCAAMSHSQKRLLTLQVVHLLVKEFVGGHKPITADDIADTLQLPACLVQEILENLIASKVVSEICRGHGKQPSFQPAHAIDVLTVKYVIDRIEKHGSDRIPRVESEAHQKIVGCLKAFDDAIDKSPANVLLKKV